MPGGRSIPFQIMLMDQGATVNRQVRPFLRGAACSRVLSNGNRGLLPIMIANSARPNRSPPHPLLSPDRKVKRVHDHTRITRYGCTFPATATRTNPEKTVRGCEDRHFRFICPWRGTAGKRRRCARYLQERPRDVRPLHGLQVLSRRSLREKSGSGNERCDKNPVRDYILGEVVYA